MKTSYESIRKQIKTGDMLLFRNHEGGGPRAVTERWIVEHATASPYTHVGMAWVEHDRVFVMDITTKGCGPRLLSTAGAFDWAPCPQALSEKALLFAFDCFQEWTYSRWQAVLGQLGLLKIGEDKRGQCAEFVLSVWGIDNMAPTGVATPAACAAGAMSYWGVSITSIAPPIAMGGGGPLEPVAMDGGGGPLEP